MALATWTRRHGQEGADARERITYSPTGLAGLEIQIAGPLSVIRGERHLEIIPIHRDSLRRRGRSRFPSPSRARILCRSIAWNSCPSVHLHHVGQVDQVERAPAVDCATHRIPV